MKAAVQGSIWRTARTAGFSASAALALTAAAPQRAQAVTIIPIFNSNMSASSKAVINSAIAFYQATYSDPVTVTIAFTNTNSGLGGSATYLFGTTYGDLSSAMFADRTTTDDNIANITPSSTNPVAAGALMALSTANGRALGYNTFGDAGTQIDPSCSASVIDACIFINLAITNDAEVGASGGYNLISVAEHEIDEVLGLGSALGAGGNSLADGGYVRVQDLFRWSAVGTRSFTESACGSEGTAYFSIDNGVTNLDGFNNCNNGGDYGDWVTHTPTQVQDAFTNNSGNPSLTYTSAEARALDVIGWDLEAPRVVATPEPSTLPLIATGFVGLFASARFRRKKSAV